MYVTIRKLLNLFFLSDNGQKIRKTQWQSQKRSDKNSKTNDKTSCLRLSFRREKSRSRVPGLNILHLFFNYTTK